MLETESKNSQKRESGRNKNGISWEDKIDPKEAESLVNQLSLGDWLLFKALHL